MIKYNNKMILDYISGNDIDEYSFDELENDYSFMYEVIKYTKDKKMYDFCSNDVKTNFEFVKMLIELFNDDKNFILNISKYYLENETKKENKKALNIFEISSMIDYFVDNKVDKIIYHIYAKEIYEAYKKEIYKLSDRSYDEFAAYIELFNNNFYILNFIAKKMIDDIFYKDNFEKVMHNIDAKDKVLIKGINAYVIDYISSFDSSLSLFVTLNSNLIKKVISDIDKNIYNWDNYEKKEIENKILIAEEITDKLVEKKYVPFSGMTLLVYCIKKLGLENIFKKYNSYYSLNMDDIKLDIINEESFLEKRVINEALVKISNLFNNKKINYEEYDDYLSSENKENIISL